MLSLIIQILKPKVGCSEKVAVNLVMLDTPFEVHSASKDCRLREHVFLSLRTHFIDS